MGDLPDLQFFAPKVSTPCKKQGTRSSTLNRRQRAKAEVLGTCLGASPAAAQAPQGPTTRASVGWEGGDGETGGRWVCCGFLAGVLGGQKVWGCSILLKLCLDLVEGCCKLFWGLGWVGLHDVAWIFTKKHVGRQWHLLLW